MDTQAKLKPKTQNFVAQWLLRVMFIWAIHIIAFLIGGLLLGLGSVARIIVGIMLVAMVLGFAFLVGKADANKDYAILATNRKNFANGAPLNETLLQFSYYKSFCIIAISLIPLLIFHIVAMIGRVLFLKGIISFYFIGTTLLFDGLGIFNSTADLVGKNFTAYAVIFSIFLLLEFVAYPIGYILSGRGRIMFHRQVEREKKVRSRDW